MSEYDLTNEANLRAALQKNQEILKQQLKLLPKEVGEINRETESLRRQFQALNEQLKVVNNNSGDVFLKTTVENIAKPSLLKRIFKK